jgi:cell division protein FtsB
MAVRCGELSAGYYLEEYERPPVSIWQRINRLLWVLLILTIVGIIIGAFLPELQKQRVERDERARLHRLIDEQRAIHARQEHEIGWLINDPEYLGIIARDKLELMKEGETILRVEPPKAPDVQDAPTLRSHPARLN